jgi:RNA polymerase sigma factor for flagellar operon FliA
MADTAEHYAVTEQHGEFAERIVKQVMARYGVSPTFYREYVGAAYTGLLEAAERFDPDENIPFEKYAYLRVRGSVIDHIRQNICESHRSFRAAKLLQASDCLTDDFQQIRSQLNSENIDEALAEVLDYAAKGALIFRLNYFDCEEELSSEITPAQCAEHQALEKELNAILTSAVELMPPREKNIIHMYYYQDYSFQEIAKKLAVGRSWVSRMHSKAIGLLREKMDELMSLQEGKVK